MIERPGEWVLLDDARVRLLATLTPLEPITIPLADALGTVVAGPVVAPGDVPPFDASAMDGYAVRSGDTAAGPTRLRVIGSAGAGRPTTSSVEPGTAVAIATGGTVPDGADAIVPIEDADVDGGEVEVPGNVESGAYVRPAGSDTAAGSVVFATGTCLGPAHIGVLASLGITTVVAHRPPRVGVLATGDEIVDAHDTPGTGQIRDANRPAMLAAARQVGADVVDLGMVPDSAEALEAALVDAAGRCDVVLTSGGVSVGVADHAKTVLGRLAGDTLQWMEVRIRPGKPFGFGVLTDSGVPVLCLPGNPVSALVVFELLVRPALAFLAGRPGSTRRIETAVADEPFARESDGKLHVVRAVVHETDDGVLHVASLPGQSSHQLRTLAGANALALVADGEIVTTGDPVRVLVLDPESLESGSTESRSTGRATTDGEAAGSKEQVA